VDMTGSQLKPFLPRPLDVLFIALNPPQQSYSNGHYFSAENSRFFKLVAASGLITREIPQALADDVVFGSTDINSSITRPNILQKCTFNSTSITCTSNCYTKLSLQKLRNSLFRWISVLLRNPSSGDVCTGDEVIAARCQ